MEHIRTYIDRTMAAVEEADLAEENERLKEALRDMLQLVAYAEDGDIYALNSPKDVDARIDLARAALEG